MFRQGEFLTLFAQLLLLQRLSVDFRGHRCKARLGQGNTDLGGEVHMCIWGGGLSDLLICTSGAPFSCLAFIRAIRCLPKSCSWRKAGPQEPNLGEHFRLPWEEGGGRSCPVSGDSCSRGNTNLDPNYCFESLVSKLPV